MQPSAAAAASAVVGAAATLTAVLAFVVAPVAAAVVAVKTAGVVAQNSVLVQGQLPSWALSHLVSLFGAVACWPMVRDHLKQYLTQVQLPLACRGR